MIKCGKDCTPRCEDCMYFIWRYSVCSLTKNKTKINNSCESFYCELATKITDKERLNSLIRFELNISLEKLKYHTEYTCDRDRENYWQGYVNALQEVLTLNK